MRIPSLSVLFACLLITGCASDACRTSIGNPSITPSRVSASDSHVGEPAQWGGILVQSRHLKGSTELEIISYPLDSCGRPIVGAGKTGRFIIVHPGFLETTDYQPGRRVSAAGRITGIRTGKVGDAVYSFPLLESYKVQLWPDQQASGSYSRPWFNIGIGGGSGGVFGGVGVTF